MTNPTHLNQPQSVSQSPRKPQNMFSLILSTFFSSFFQNTSQPEDFSGRTGHPTHLRVQRHHHPHHHQPVCVISKHRPLQHAATTPDKGNHNLLYWLHVNFRGFFVFVFFKYFVAQRREEERPPALGPPYEKMSSCVERVPH